MARPSGAIDVTSGACQRGRRGGGATAAIGRPIANTQAYVLDGVGELAPVGAVGELYVGGAGVGRGYSGRPGLTASRFVPDHLGVASGGRLYRTGDLCRHWPDGTLEYVGRRDEQVKLRGYRVELGEVESVIREHAAVTAAVVVVHSGAAGRQQLVAYYVLGGASVSSETLRGWASARLPGYMVPSQWVELRSLPRTRHGKVDRRALPSPETSAVSSSARVAPRTPLEETLAGIWRDVLGVDAVGVHDNFFELGGSSLSAIVCISRIREEFHVELPVRVVFEERTVAGLALAVVAAQIDIDSDVESGEPSTDALAMSDSG